MGYKIISLKLATDYTSGDLKKAVGRKLKVRDFQVSIIGKSLDARDKNRIHWLIRLGVSSPEIKGEPAASTPPLDIPKRKREGRVVITGSGPAGIFTGLVLQRAGFRTTIVERGSEVDVRDRAVQEFETSGLFNSRNNYAFGEGGAGTFSDGKLTSRSKHISREKRFITESYIKAGAPEEIGFLAHPHLGTDNLLGITRSLRRAYEEMGGEFLFDTLLEDLIVQGGRVTAAKTSRGILDASHVIIAAGHSAYETFRMLMNRGVGFNTKNFALGCRIEHSQETINRAQWGTDHLPGVKAAEYRLTAKPDGGLPVYTFCMCPGGVVVPASAYRDGNIVNGMSRYKRDGLFANAACVAGVNLDELLDREVDPCGALSFVEELEHKFYEFSGGYNAPYATIEDFLNERVSSGGALSSYPMGLIPAPLNELLPRKVSHSLKLGLEIFSRKIKGFNKGIIMGLESKTSSPLQVQRSKSGLCSGFSNLYVVGEGSGWSGGIISSGADGIRAALSLAEE
ncbi:MAG: FAD-dependent monooxygenase [Spirochaetales bacterium]|nr:FAD-dependent monooxygenase [Spirochaetales bacterium]